MVSRELEDPELRRSRATAIAIILGIFYPLTVTLVLTAVFGSEGELSTALYVAGYLVGYGIIGAVLGFFWPNYCWRLGLWLVAFWFLLLIGMALISDPVPWNTKLVLKDLAWHMSVVVAAFLGVAVGKIIGRRRIASP